MFWVGINSFGGPVAQIGVMHQEAVERRKWVTDAEFVHLLNFANILPGPEALEIAIHLGYLRRGIRGGIVAGLLFIWPGFVSLTALAWVYLNYGALKGVTGFLDGMRPAAMALIAAAAVRLSSRALKGPAAYTLMTIAFLASYLIGVPFLPVLLGSGFLGLWLARRGGGAPAKPFHGFRSSSRRRFSAGRDGPPRHPKFPAMLLPRSHALPRSLPLFRKPV